MSSIQLSVTFIRLSTKNQGHMLNFSHRTHFYGAPGMEVHLSDQ